MQRGRVREKVFGYRRDGLGVGERGRAAAQAGRRRQLEETVYYHSTTTTTWTITGRPVGYWRGVLTATSVFLLYEAQCLRLGEPGVEGRRGAAGSSGALGAERRSHDEGQTPGVEYRIVLSFESRVTCSQLFCFVVLVRWYYWQASGPGTKKGGEERGRGRA